MQLSPACFLRLAFCAILFLCFCRSASAQKPGQLALTYASAARTHSAPLIDGEIHSSEWANATRLSDFVLTSGARGEAAPHATSCLVTYDDKFLYLAIVSAKSSEDAYKMNGQFHDDPSIFFDERVEVFIDANHDHRTYYNFVVNPAGIQLEQSVTQHMPNTRTHFPDLGWNGFWKARTSLKDKEWIAELAISLSAIGFDSIPNGTTIGLNVGSVKSPSVTLLEAVRTYVVKPPAQYSAWAMVQDGIWETVSNFNAPDMFGDLVLGSDRLNVKSVVFPKASYQGGLGRPTLQGWNSLEIAFEKAARSPLELMVSVSGTADGELFSINTQEEVLWSDLQSIDSDEVLISTRFYIPRQGENKLTIQLRDPQTKALLYETAHILQVPPLLKLDLEGLYNEEGDSKPITFKPQFGEGWSEDDRLVMQFTDTAGNVIEQQAFVGLPPDSPQQVFDVQRLRNLPGGNYNIVSILTGGEETKHVSVQPLTKFFGTVSDKPLNAEEGQYAYGGLVDHAVTVNFPSGAKFVFWRSASYIPWWDLGQATTSNEFVESWGEGLEGCAEPIQDRECRFSSVEILENTPARVKVLWRYALNDTHYRIYANEWVDEYYTFYPDGTGIREVNLHANTTSEHEVFEAIYVNPPHVSTYQLFDTAIVSLTNLAGKTHNVHDFKKAGLYEDFVLRGEPIIFENHFKNRLHPYTVFAFGNDRLLPNILTEKISVGRRLAPDGTRRGHWPASIYPVDGYNAVGDDRPGHFSLGNIHVMSDQATGINTWFFLIGVKEHGSSEDVQNATNWLSPPRLLAIGRRTPTVEYRTEDKAYVVSSRPGVKNYSFRLSERSLHHPVLIFEGEQAELKSVKVNGRTIRRNDYRTGRLERKTIIYFSGNIKAGDRLDLAF